MCYVLKFNFDDSYKACKFTAFPRTFQIINYIFFKEVYNPKRVKVLSFFIQQVLKSMSFLQRLCEGGNLCFLKPSKRSASYRFPLTHLPAWE